MLNFYDSLQKKKLDFSPLYPRRVGIYQCGPTVYWTQHIGNLRAMVLADLVVRSLTYLGYKVNFVRNYTDVGHLTSDSDAGEDKMAKGAQREGKTPLEIAQRYIDSFDQDLERLNVLPPMIGPRATEHISAMIEMIQELIDKGYAYTTDLAVYFDVSKAKDYTKLSGQKLEKNQTDAGHGEVSDPAKHQAADFALWFFKAGTHRDALQTWPSPFVSSLVENGEGFPGWHIECSAMARQYLGSTLDIHMGGIEHIPVHHTNEIAQSEAANGKPLANYWLHNEHLTVAGSKMAKSDGTTFILDDVIDRGYDPLVLRYFFLQAHYRSKQNFTWEALDGAKVALANIQQIIHQAVLNFAVTADGGVQLVEHKIGSGKVNKDYRKNFISAIEDDINLPQALAVCFDLIKSDVAPDDKRATLLDFDRVLGLGLDRPQADIAVEDIGLIKKLVADRHQARLAKDWVQSDNLRDELLENGYMIKDSEDGYQVSLLNLK